MCLKSKVDFFTNSEIAGGGGEGGYTPAQAEIMTWTQL